MAAPSSTAFVQSVWEQLEASGPTDFARKLRLGPDGLQKVRRWRRGGRLDYEDTMRMLEACGWVSLGQQANGHPQPATPSDDRLEGVEDVLEELVENQRAMLAKQEETLRLLRPARGRRSA